MNTFNIIFGSLWYLYVLHFIVWYYHTEAHYDSLNNLLNIAYHKAIAAIDRGEDPDVPWKAYKMVWSTR